MSAGRPPKYETAEDLQKKVDEYFSQDDVKLTISGLCYFLGFESRQSFYAYENKPEFSYTVKRARAMIEQMYEEKLLSNHVTGAIFALKNLGWVDRQTIDQTIDDRRMRIVTSPEKAKELERLN